MVCKYRLSSTPSLSTKNWKKGNRSPLKLLTCSGATKLNTVCAPFEPVKTFQVDPSIVGVAMGVEPELEIGPAPPSAASQIMISYVDPAEELADVPSHMSYATSATMSSPVYLLYY